MRDVHKLKEKFELSLDTGQIVTLTLVGLIALGGVFVLGVAVGKKLSTEQKVAEPVDLLSQLDAKSAPGPTLTYHDELTKQAPKPKVETAPAAVAAAPAPPSPSDKPEPAAAQAPAAAVAEAPKPSAAPEVSAPTPPRADLAIATRTAARPADDGGDLREAFARAQKPAETTPDGAWTLQLSAYQDKSEADRFAAELRGRGYAPFVVEATVPGKGQWFRVRMGRFATKEAAGRYLSDFQRETQIQAFVTNAR